MKYIFLIACVFCVSVSARSLHDHDCTEFGFSSFQDDSFSLEIDTSFNGQVKFEVAKSTHTIGAETESKQETKYYFIVTKTKLEMESDARKIKRITSCENKQISEGEYKKIFKLYKDALMSNFLDQVQGLDGSIWCLEIDPYGILERKICLWTPSADPKKRHIEGFYNLGEYLWKFSGLENSKEFELY